MNLLKHLKQTHLGLASSQHSRIQPAYFENVVSLLLPIILQQANIGLTDLFVGDYCQCIPSSQKLSSLLAGELPKTCCVIRRQYIRSRVTKDLAVIRTSVQRELGVTNREQ